LRDLELKAAGAPRRERVALERAFNIVGQPELRAVYDALLADPEAPAVFPYGGFGSLGYESAVPSRADAARQFQGLSHKGIAPCPSLR
jgi:hypothetical protein